MKFDQILICPTNLEIGILNHEVSVFLNGTIYAQNVISQWYSKQCVSLK